MAFTVSGLEPGLVYAALSAEYGIAARSGPLCLHPLVRPVMSDPAPPEPLRLAVRASIGLGATVEHVDRLVDAVRAVADFGFRLFYEARDGRWEPRPDLTPQAHRPDADAGPDATPEQGRIARSAVGRSTRRRPFGSGCRPIGDTTGTQVSSTGARGRTVGWTRAHYLGLRHREPVR